MISYCNTEVEGLAGGSGVRWGSGVLVLGVGVLTVHMCCKGVLILKLLATHRTGGVFHVGVNHPYVSV